MKLHESPETFDSILAQHVDDNSYYSILFHSTCIVATIKSLIQVSKDAVRAEKHVHKNFDFN